MTQTRIIGTDAVKSELLALPDKLRREVVLVCGLAGAFCPAV